MRRPNLAFNMFSNQPFSIYGQVFYPNFVLSPDLSEFINVAITEFNIFCLYYPILPGPTLLFLELPDPDLTYIFSTRRNTSHRTFKNEQNRSMCM